MALLILYYYLGQMAFLILVVEEKVEEGRVVDWEQVFLSVHLKILNPFPEEEEEEWEACHVLVQCYHLARQACTLPLHTEQLLQTAAAASVCCPTY